MNFSELTDYNFLNDSEFETKMKSLESDSLVKMKIFNDHGQENYDRTIYIEMPFNDLGKINNCLTHIRSFHFPSGKSFATEIIYKNEHNSH